MSQQTASPVVKPRVTVWCPKREFLHPYVEREFDGFDVEFSLGDNPGDDTVMISSTDVYDVTTGVNYAEDAPVGDTAAERQFIDWCTSHGLKPTILRCANIVGTGMTGWPMQLARGVARGTLLHVEGVDDQAVVSVVHAVDVARVARFLRDCGKTVNVTDGTATTLHDLIEALAYRIDNKRVGTLKPRWARWIYGKKRLCRLGSSLTFSDARLRRLMPADQMPLNRVTDYLTHHVYDDASL